MSENYLPYTEDVLFEMSTNSENMAQGIRHGWESSPHGENERTIIRQTNTEDGIEISLNVLQFYPPDILIDHLGL